MIANLACRLCEQPTSENDALCKACKAAKGPRVAALLARALADPNYASACLACLAPKPRARFAQLLSAELLASPARLMARGPGVRSTRPAASVRPIALRAVN